jgi:hypothetical protein
MPDSFEIGVFSQILVVRKFVNTNPREEFKRSLTNFLQLFLVKDDHNQLFQFKEILTNVRHFFTKNLIFNVPLQFSLR